MKKWLIPIVLALVLLGDGERTDISRLEPVEAMQILSVQGGVQVLTDTGSKGYGTTLERAVENLHSSSANQIFLETVQYLLVDSRDWLVELDGMLRPACCVYVVKEQADLELAAKYLEIHGPRVTLGQYKAGETELPIFYSKEGRSQIVY